MEGRELSQQVADSALRRRVLIVEDEGMTVMFLRRILRSGGYDVVGEAANGALGVEAARRTQPDFILMDINMPVLNGIEATKQIIAERPVPIIILTAYSDNSYVESAKEAGASGYLLKPVAVPELMPAIREAFASFDARWQGADGIGTAGNDGA